MYLSPMTFGMTVTTKDLTFFDLFEYRADTSNTSPSNIADSKTLFFFIFVVKLQTRRMLFATINTMQCIFIRSIPVLNIFLSLSTVLNNSLSVSLIPPLVVRSKIRFVIFLLPFFILVWHTNLSSYFEKIICVQAECSALLASLSIYFTSEETSLQ